MVCSGLGDPNCKANECCSSATYALADGADQPFDFNYCALKPLAGSVYTGVKTTAGSPALDSPSITLRYKCLADPNAKNAYIL